MRRVFCKAEDPKQTIDSFAKRLHEKYKIPMSMIVKDMEKNEIECGYYNIHFCMEREWEILSTTRPGSGYLTIPYNRLLLSKNGVLPEECKLNNLFKIIAESCSDTENIDSKEESSEIVDTATAVIDNDTDNNAVAVSIPKKVQFNI